MTPSTAGTPSSTHVETRFIEDESETAAHLSVRAAQLGMLALVPWVPVRIYDGDYLRAFILGLAAMPLPAAVWLARHGHPLASRVLVGSMVMLAASGSAVLRPLDAGPASIVFGSAIFSTLLLRSHDPRWTRLLPPAAALLVVYVALRTDMPATIEPRHAQESLLAFGSVFLGLYAALSTQQGEQERVERRLDASLRELERLEADAEAARVHAERARETAEAATRARSSFLAMMSHEVRTPLNGVLGMSELLRAGPVSEDQREMLDTIGNSGEALLRVLNDILDFSKIEAGAMRLEQASFNPEEVARDALRDAPNARLNVDTGRRLIAGDATRWGQVITQLAARAAPGPVGIEILLTAQDATAELRVTAREHGYPDPERVSLAAFGAPPGLERKVNAEALGIAISRRLIEAMGGELSVQTDEDQRATVTIRTLHPWSHATRTPTPAPAPTVAGIIARRVLVAEDNPVNAKVVERMLRSLGVTDVDLRQDGAQAVEALAANRYDLVLMDVQMPVLGGYEATARWRTIEAELGRFPVMIVALTANGFAEERANALNAGMDGFLTKPVSREALRRVLEGDVSSPTPVA